MTLGTVGCLAAPAGGAARRGRIRAVFARCVHAACDDCCLTLGDESLPAHPYSILWQGFPGGWRVGEAVAVTAEGVFARGGLMVAAASLAPFSPPTSRRPMAGPPRNRRALAASAAAARAIPRRGGFHDLLHDFPGPAPSEATGRLSGAIGGLERRLGARLARALARGDWEDFAGAARDLAGLGQGLTPAGDDFLAGVLAALRFHGESSGAPLFPRQSLADLAGELAGRTTPFSGFLLRCAARGLVAGPVGDWLAAAHGGEAAKAGRAVAALAGLGHSSGLDALSGMWLAVRTVTDTGGPTWIED